MRNECLNIVEILEARIQELKEVGPLLLDAGAKLENRRTRKGKGERDSDTKKAVATALQSIDKLLGRPGKPPSFDAKLIRALSTLRERIKDLALDDEVEALFAEAEERLKGENNIVVTRQQEGDEAMNELDVPETQETAFVMLHLIQESEVEILTHIQESFTKVVIPAVESGLAEPIEATLNLDAEFGAAGAQANVLVILDANFARDVYEHCNEFVRKHNRGGFRLAVQTPTMLIPKSVMDELANPKKSKKSALLGASYRSMWEKIAVESGGGVFPFNERQRTANAEALLKQLWNGNRGAKDPSWDEVKKMADGLILHTALARSPQPTRVLTADHVIVKVIAELQAQGHPISVSRCSDVIDHGNLTVI